MGVFLVDMEFREKAKQYLTSREMMFVILFLLFALVPWVEVMEMARGLTNRTDIEGFLFFEGGGGGGGGGAPHCNPHTRSCLNL